VELIEKIVELDPLVACARRRRGDSCT
jgi:hypothetical protein